jgi:Flp pilus assembly protein TadG
VKRSGRLSFAHRFRRAESGAAMVEFAMIIPVLIVLYLGGYQASQAVAVYRKTADTTVELGNVATQYTTMSDTDVSTVMNAASQVMYPYDTSTLAIVLSEIVTDAKGKATVSWSKANSNGTGLAQGSVVQLPAGMAQPNTYYVLVNTSYRYTPWVNFGFSSPVTMTSQIYRLPRQSASIPETG